MSDDVSQNIGTRSGVQTIRNIRSKLFLTFLSIVLIITAVFILFTIQLVDKQKEERISRDLTQANAWFQKAIENQILAMHVGIQGILINEEALEIFRTRDRGQLFEYLKPHYDELNRSIEVTHAYFTDADRTNFIRLHKPERFGDVIDRKTTLLAQQTKSMSAGLEHGVLGTLTLRVVEPIIVNSEIAGFIELGMEVGHLLAQVEDTFEVTAFIALKRTQEIDNLANRSGLSSETVYRVLDDYLIVNTGAPSKLDDFSALIDSVLSEEIKVVQTLGMEHGIAMSGTSMTLLNTQGVDGKLIILRDVTEIHREAFNIEATYVLLTLFLSIASLIFFNRVVREVKRDVRNVYQDLDDSLSSRTDELLESERKLEEAQKIANLGSWQLDIKEDELYWSEETYRICEVDRKSFGATYKAFLNIVHPDDRELVHQSLQHSIKVNSKFDLIHRLLMPDGRVKWVHEQGMTRFDTNGTPIESIGTVQDITDLKRAEYKSHISEQRLRAIFDGTTDGVVLINKTGTILEVNPAFENMFEFEDGELIGQNISVVVPHGHREKHDGYLEKLVKGEASEVLGKSRELAGQKKNNEIIPIRLGIGKIEFNEETYFVGMVTELTELKKLETQIRHSQKMDAIGELSGGIAHDFNNILGIIIGQLDLLKSVLEDDESSYKRADKAQNAALRGAELTKKLLNFSSQSNDAVSPINVNSVISGMNDLISKSLTSRVSIETFLEEDVWMTELDPASFEDALINLSLNARDAMTEGGVLSISTRNVTLDSSSRAYLKNAASGDFVEIAISDDGTGIPKDIIDKIYDPFFTTKKQNKGTGLGLSMVYGFVERSGGVIDVYSEEGIGTTFKLYFPRTYSTSQSSNTQYVSELDSLPHGNETILIIDDEPALAELAGNVLTELGYHTIVVHSAKDGLQYLYESDKIDLVFSDVVMPGMDGFALANEINDHFPGVRVLLTSGFTGKINVDDKSVKLADSMLPKPYRNIELATKVRQALDGVV